MQAIKLMRLKGGEVRALGEQVYRTVQNTRKRHKITHLLLYEINHDDDDHHTIRVMRRFLF